MDHTYFQKFKSIFFKNASMFKKTFLKMESEFDDAWTSEFDLHLGKLFGEDEESYEDSIRGYTKFAIDAMRLQRLFNKKLVYEDVSYQEACEKVYMNEEYMMKLYLPGILTSHFLWRHHYRQFVYYKENFLPLLDSEDDKRFYDVGTGTGFYSVQMFRHDAHFKGFGIDMSPHSRKFTKNHVAAWGAENSFTSMDTNIIGADLEPLSFIMAVEVLEHLSDPQPFIDSLRKLLKPGGHGFITAALTAPNADHIYLYWTPDDVIKQLETAGFKIDDYLEEVAYEVANPEEHVPKVAAFIVS